MKELIINADDFGLTHGVNEGIRRAHREGILTSTTLMANGAAFDHAVECAKSCPALGVGCHLVLVGGHCVAPGKEIPSLADSEGRLPASLPSLVARVSSGMVRSKDIEREFRAQIGKIRAAGIEPTHLDSHKHTHAHPRVMAALSRVAKEMGIQRVRRPFETLKNSWATTRRTGKPLSKQLVAAAAARTAAPRFDALARKFGLHTPGNFLGVASTGQLGSDALRHLVEILPDGQTEIMIHPGVYDAELIATGSRLQKERQLELDALLDPEVKGEIVARQIRLITFRELK